MDSKNPQGKKRTPDCAPSLNPDAKMQRQNNSSTEEHDEAMERCGESSSSIDTKICNAAKLRQQFVDEIKEIELSMKKSIEELKRKISEIDKKSDIMTGKLNQANESVYSQSKVIYKNEQESKTVREKVEELYEYQKQICENMVDITSTLASQEKLTDQFTEQFSALNLILDNHIRNEEQELINLTNNEIAMNLELEEINSQISSREKEIIQYEKKIEEWELNVKAKKAQKEKDEQELQKMDEKIRELEVNNKIYQENANQEKRKLQNDVEELKKVYNVLVNEESELDKAIAEIKMKLETEKIFQNDMENKIKDVNMSIESMTAEGRELDEQHYKQEQENSITLDKLREKLKASQDELAAVHQKESQAVSVLQKNIIDIRAKLKSYESIDAKLEKYESEVKRKENEIENLNREFDIEEKMLEEKIKETENKINNLKDEVQQQDKVINELEGNVVLLEKETKELEAKLEAALKLEQKSIEKNLSTKRSSQFDLPDLFTAETSGNTVRQSRRKTVYTPTFDDDDMEEIDALSLEEQFSRLTQSKTNQSESPEKSKRFFKHTSLSQPKRKEEERKGTPRSRGRNRK